MNTTHVSSISEKYYFIIELQPLSTDSHDLRPAQSADRQRRWRFAGWHLKQVFHSSSLRLILCQKSSALPAPSYGEYAQAKWFWIAGEPEQPTGFWSIAERN